MPDKSAQLDPIKKVVNLMARLPGIGEKSATRITFALLAKEKEYAYQLSESIQHLVERITLCSTCYNLTEKNPCSICSNPKRDHSIICVVENVPDLLAIERTSEFQGVYHVLHGVLAPIDGITPDKLKIAELIHRIESQPIKEVIIATNPTIEGDSTALYLHKKLQSYPIKITRIASGIPMGGDLEYIDKATLSRALLGRREF